MRSARLRLVGVSMTLLGSAACGGTPYAPRIAAADFSSTVDNPFYPLVPGTKLKFIEKEGDETRENMVEVTKDTKTILGVRCVVVHDSLTIGGKLEEDTLDWFAQDKDGNVWYFGENTKEFKGDKIDTKGSWEAGVAGAQPGIIMQAHPKQGDPYRQEYKANEAEDMGQIEDVDASVTVPAGKYTGCVRTKEWSLLDTPTEKKWYCKGVGNVKTESTTGEVSTLESVVNP